MTREQLLEIAKRHAEDHNFTPRNHPRPAWPQDAVGDRGALLELVADLVTTTHGAADHPLKDTLKQLRPALQKPELPALQAPGLPPLRTRKLRGPSRRD
jgi:hypothetical protein